MEAPPRAGIIMAVCILGIFGLLVVNMPSEFLTAGSEQTEYVERPIPYFFTQSEIQGFAVTYVVNITGAYFSDQWGDAEGFEHDMWLEAWRGSRYLYNLHCFPFWIFYGFSTHKMEWFNENLTSRGMDLSSSDMALDMENSTTDFSTAFYRIECEHFYISARIGYNSTAYGYGVSGINNAWDNDGLTIEWGIDAEEIQKSHVMNAWSLITMLLTFQMPEIYQEPGLIWINLMIGLPLWTLIAIIVYQITLSLVKALPFT